MKRLLISLLGCLLLVACQDGQSETVFIPAVGSSEQEVATAVSETVFVPVTQSDSEQTSVADEETIFVPAVQAGEGASEQTGAVSESAKADVGTSGQGNADVQFVAVRATDDNVWTFNVTVAHPDTGWEDYADGWDVVLSDGTVVKPDVNSPFTRLLLHPHETEQPFTRSQSGIVIPANVTMVTVRAHDLVEGFGGREVVVDLMAASGPDFTVER